MAGRELTKATAATHIRAAVNLPCDSSFSFVRRTRACAVGPGPMHAWSLTCSHRGVHVHKSTSEVNVGPPVRVHCQSTPGHSESTMPLHSP
jgi:hypothetical protein